MVRNSKNMLQRKQSKRNKKTKWRNDPKENYINTHTVNMYVCVCDEMAQGGDEF